MYTLLQKKGNFQNVTFLLKKSVREKRLVGRLFDQVLWEKAWRQHYQLLLWGGGTGGDKTVS